MKKIFFVLAATIAIVSCNQAEKKNTTASNATVSQDSLDKLNKVSNDANQHVASPVNSNPPTDSSQTMIQWMEGTEKDFGQMKEGDMLDVSFTFKNVGNKPLVISNVTAGCGCTVPETPKKPYAPGETGVIKAVFNSALKTGSQSKPINVFANANPQMTTLTFRVEVKSKS